MKVARGGGGGGLSARYPKGKKNFFLIPLLVPQHPESAALGFFGGGIVTFKGKRIRDHASTTSLVRI